MEDISLGRGELSQGKPGTRRKGPSDGPAAPDRGQVEEPSRRAWVKRRGKTKRRRTPEHHGSPKGHCFKTLLRDKVKEAKEAPAGSSAWRSDTSHSRGVSGEGSGRAADSYRGALKLSLSEETEAHSRM